MNRDSPADGGQIIAATLARAWRRRQSTELEIAASDLQAIAAHLRRSGAAGLAWWRIRDTALANSSCAASLQHDYRLQALRCAAYELRIAYLFRLFEQAAVDAILLKGWGSASFYADVTLRPYGDIDILVRPEDLARAKAVLSDAAPSEIDTDLHDRVTDLPGRTFRELHGRSRVLQIGESKVRVLGVEDHLAHVCLHFIRHYAWRPVWLCDVAATLEALPPDFDWALCCGRDAIETKWIDTIIALARMLLNSEQSSRPERHCVLKAPEWLVKWMLSYWVNDSANRPLDLTPLSRFLTRPRGMWRDIQGRWPNPIAAALHFGCTPQTFPLPYQAAIFLTRGLRFCGRFALGRSNQSRGASELLRSDRP